MELSPQRHLLCKPFAILFCRHWVYVQINIVHPLTATPIKLTPISAYKDRSYVFQSLLQWGTERTKQSCKSSLKNTGWLETLSSQCIILTVAKLLSQEPLVTYLKPNIARFLHQESLLYQITSFLLLPTALLICHAPGRRVLWADQ